MVGGVGEVVVWLVVDGCRVRVVKGGILFSITATVFSDGRGPKQKRITMLFVQQYNSPGLRPFGVCV